MDNVLWYVGIVFNICLFPLWVLTMIIGATTESFIIADLFTIGVVMSFVGATIAKVKGKW